MCNLSMSIAGVWTGRTDEQSVPGADLKRMGMIMTNLAAKLQAEIAIRQARLLDRLRRRGLVTAANEYLDIVLLRDALNLLIKLPPMDLARPSRAERRAATIAAMEQSPDA